MAQQILFFDEGNPATLLMTFTNPVNGQNVQPSVVKFYWKPLGVQPAASVTTWTAGIDPQITVGPAAVNGQNLLLGQYLAILPLTVTNGRKSQSYECRWEGTGSWPGSYPFVIVVTAKNV